MTGDGTDRAVTADAWQMIGARHRARTDNRRAALLLTIVASLAVGYVVGQIDTGCDRLDDGCRFVDQDVTYQTVGDATWPVCKSEDAAGPCVWDARRDGNGMGESFLVSVDGTVTPI